MLKKLALLLAVLFFCMISLNALVLIGENNVFAAPEVVVQACDVPGADQNPYCREVNNPTTENPIAKTIGKVVTFFAWLAGVCAVIWIIYGGFRFVTSYGDPQKVAAARETILYAVIGLIVIAVSQTLIIFILKKLGG